MLTILKNKPFIGDLDVDYRLDLLSKSATNKYNTRDELVVIVKKGEEMRPDILSSNFFGDISYYDVLLKYNGVSNPFSIDEGEAFFAPSLDGLKKNLAPSARTASNKENVRDQYINVDKKSMLDNKLAIIDVQRQEKIQDAIRKKAEGSSNPGSLLPPNVAEANDREITVEGGKIYFGRDVVHGKDECTRPLSKSEFMAKLIKSKLETQ